MQARYHAFVIVERFETLKDKMRQKQHWLFKDFGRPLGGIRFVDHRASTASVLDAIDQIPDSLPLHLFAVHWYIDINRAWRLIGKLKTPDIGQVFTIFRPLNKGCIGGGFLRRPDSIGPAFCYLQQVAADFRVIARGVRRNDCQYARGEFAKATFSSLCGAAVRPKVA